MTTLKANGPAIERLIQQMKLTDPRISYQEVCNRTALAAEKKGSGLTALSIKTLFDARNSKWITLDRLHALAQVLGVEVDEITLKEEGAVVPATPNALTFVMNFPPEIIGTETVKKLSTLPAQTVQSFLDIATRMISTLGTDHASPDEQSRRVLIGIANQSLAEEMDEVDATAAFGETRNPQKEKRFERNTRLILEKVVKYLNSKDVPNGAPDQTFLDYFFEYCQKASDPDAQEFWAEILAAKIQRPEGLSLRTLRLLQDINQKIAGLFVRLCGIVFVVDGDCVSIRLSDSDDHLSWAGLTFPDLLLLADYGLVSLGVKSFVAKIGDRFEYFDRSFQATRTLKFKANPLTVAGSELFALTSSKESNIYFDSVRSMFGEGVGPTQRDNSGKTISVP